MPRAHDEGYVLYETPLGISALRWGQGGLLRNTLPHPDPGAALEDLGWGPAETEGRPPAWVRDCIRRIERHLGGRTQDLTGVRLDLSWATPFSRQVYEALRLVPAGTTVSYGELAARAGSPGAARAVGGAMRRNRLSLIVPCHRVVGAAGPGGFSAPDGLEIKARLLELEGGSLPGPESFPRPLFPEATEQGLRHLKAKDRDLARLIDRVGAPDLDISRRRSPYQALVRSVVYQQLTGKAAATILGRVKALFPGRRFPPPGELLATPDEALRGAGLSRAKTAALKDLAARTMDGTVPPLRTLRRMDDDQIIERLVEVRGIGPWSVEMFLIFSLGRTDVLPVGDYGVRKGFQSTFRTRELPDAAAMRRRAAAWRPYRSLASWYLWRAADGL